MTKCFACHHMTPVEFAVWDFGRSVSHRSGELNFNGRKIAASFQGLGKSTVYEAATSLTAKGFFKLVKDTKRQGGRYTPRQYRVLSHAEWAAEHPGQCGAVAAYNGGEDETAAPSVPAEGLAR